MEKVPLPLSHSRYLAFMTKGEKKITFLNLYLLIPGLVYLSLIYFSCL